MLNLGWIIIHFKLIMINPHFCNLKLIVGNHNIKYHNIELNNYTYNTWQVDIY